MALHKLQDIVKEKAVRDAQAENDRRRVIAEAVQAQLEHQESHRHALQCLQQLEDFFWKCANDFSRLANLKIYYTNRPKFHRLTRLFGGYAATIHNLELYVSYDSDGRESKDVRLKVLGQKELQFSADYKESSSLVRGRGYVGGKTYVSMFKNLPVDTFEVQAARKWLESNFEEFYKKLHGI